MREREKGGGGGGGGGGGSGMPDWPRFSLEISVRVVECEVRELCREMRFRVGLAGMTAVQEEFVRKVRGRCMRCLWVYC